MVSLQWIRQKDNYSQEISVTSIYQIVDNSCLK